MSKQKVTNNTQVSTGAVEKPVSESTKCRETLAALYAAQATQTFVGVACKTFHKTDTQFVSEEDVMNVLREVYNHGNSTEVVIYTQPSKEETIADDMSVVVKSWNKALPIGQKWYKKTAPVTDAFVLLRAYTNYLRFKEDSDKALLRSAKKAVANMTQEELIAFVLEQQKKAQAQTTDTQTDNND